MAFDDNEMEQRRKLREEQRQRLLRQQKQLRIRLGIAAAVLIACTVLIVVVSRRSAAAPDEGKQQTAPTQWGIPEPEDMETQPTEESLGQTVVNIAFAGDLNINDAVVNACTGDYNYTRVFRDVLPQLSDADLTVVNFEGNVSGAPYGSETSSAPKELLDALVRAGVDMLQVANSCAISNGMIGLQATLQAMENAGLEPVGAYASVSDAKKSGGYTIREVNGVRIAFVAFTKGMDSMALPEGSERCVNLLYKDYASNYQQVNYDGIRSIMRAASRERPDVTIVLLHWGSEYNDTLSRTQQNIMELIYDEGADAIIGTHPHYVQTMEFDEAKGRFTCYSLGDFLNEGIRTGTDYSVILNLEISKDNDTDATRITGFSYTPIYTVAEKGTLKVVRLEEAIEAYNQNNLDAVNAKTFANMEYGLGRIEDRIHNPMEVVGAS